MDERTRCGWANGDALMAEYHDREWGVPVRDPRLLWEMLMLEGFQAGLSWSIILKRREAFHSAFAGWDPDKVAAFGPSDVERLMLDPGIIRARAKIEGAIGNARAYLAMRQSGENFSDWAWALAGGAPAMGSGVDIPAKSATSEALSKALKAKGFKFVGPVIVYAWMQAVGMVNDHAAACFRRNAV
jgi:DNA-3-methyladenine glycosylase I